MDKVKCPECETEFFPSLKDALLSVTSFDSWESQWLDDLEPRYVENLGYVSVVELSTPERDSYGDATGPTYMIFEVGYGTAKNYYKVDGYYSSYDGYSWDGPFTQVTKKTKTVTEWV